MDFSWTEEQEIWRRTVRDFAQKKITPKVREIDTNKKIPETIIKDMAKLGLLAPTASPEYGGAGVDWTMAAIAAEELGRADISLAIPVLYLVEAAWGFIFSRYGTEETKKKYLPKITSGDAFCGIAVTEPEGGSDIVGAAKTKAEKKDKKWVLNGEKIFISGITESSKWGGIHLTLARTDPSKAHKGFSFFAVPLKDNPNIETSLFEDMGRMGISTGGFNMQNAELPENHLIGELNKGFYYALELFDGTRIIVAAQAVGMAQGAFEKAFQYAKTRKQFGSPIISFQGISFKLADMATKIEAARMLTQKAAWLFDQGKVDPMATSMAKAFAGRIAMEVTDDAIQIHGGYGYLKDYHVERFHRCAKITEIYEGTTEIQKLTIMNQLTKRM